MCTKPCWMQCQNMTSSRHFRFTASFSCLSLVVEVPVWWADMSLHHQGCERLHVRLALRLVQKSGSHWLWWSQSGQLLPEGLRGLRLCSSLPRTLLTMSRRLLHLQTPSQLLCTPGGWRHSIGFYSFSSTWNARNSWSIFMGTLVLLWVSKPGWIIHFHALQPVQSSDLHLKRHLQTSWPPV